MSTSGGMVYSKDVCLEHEGTTFGQAEVTVQVTSINEGVDFK